MGSCEAWGLRQAGTHTHTLQQRDGSVRARSRRRQGYEEGARARGELVHPSVPLGRPPTTREVLGAS